MTSEHKPSSEAGEGCDFCNAGAVFSIAMPSYHVTEFFEGHEVNRVLCRLASRNVMRHALLRIAHSTVPDQPASSPDEEPVWLMKHIALLRRIAQEAVTP